MVTAIVIPIICIYFYWLTKKELKEHDEKWLKLLDVPEEAIVSGTILSISEEKQRFYYHRWIHVLEIKIESSHQTITVKKISPLSKEFQKDFFQIGEHVTLYGNWKGKTFQFGRFKLSEVK